ncbi:MAG: ImmA/IrrE family metallo-endopeptidase [Deltaproteobacteria bacterium]|nr:ImmA/IrrE family metallo-endopeptidase [Deltaproteobacteria bacterium]
MRIPWLTKKSIAAAAHGLIADYEAKLERRVQPPIPVENIIECGLSLRLGFADLRKTLKLDDVLGATYVKKRMICVDQSLAENQNEGRLCFTFAHETGHWVLHRNLIDQAHRSGGAPNLPQSMGGFIFCRIQDAKKPIEWQADYFASCLLMPAEAVRDAFCRCYGTNPLILYNVKSAYSGPVCFDPCVETWPQIAAMIKEAGGFYNVSKQAMIIRLQDLELVRNETQAQLSWAESYCFS